MDQGFYYVVDPSFIRPRTSTLNNRGRPFTAPNYSGHRSVSPKRSPKSRQGKPKKCDICKHLVLNSGYQEHRKKCQEKLKLESDLFPIPTNDFSIREIRRFVVLKSLAIDTKLTNDRRKSDIIKDINSELKAQKEKRAKNDITLCCEICGSLVLKPGFEQHSQKCRARNDGMLKSQKSLPSLGSTQFRHMKQFAQSKGLNLEIDPSKGKFPVLEEISSALQSPHKKLLPDPTVKCPECKLSVLKASLTPHLQKCKVKNKALAYEQKFGNTPQDFSKDLLRFTGVFEDPI